MTVTFQDSHTHYTLDVVVCLWALLYFGLCLRLPIDWDFLAFLFVVIFVAVVFVDYSVSWISIPFALLLEWWSILRLIFLSQAIGATEGIDVSMSTLLFAKSLSSYNCSPFRLTTLISTSTPWSFDATALYFIVFYYIHPDVPAKVRQIMSVTHIYIYHKYRA